MTYSMRLLFLVLAILPRPGFAFGYGEHAGISETAFIAACKQFEKENSDQLSRFTEIRSRFGELCGENVSLAAKCMGHFVAIAGDHIEAADKMWERIQDQENHVFFKNPTLDCQTFPAPKLLNKKHGCVKEKFAEWDIPEILRPAVDVDGTSVSSAVRAVRCRQAPGGFFHWLKSMGLAMQNESHFAPDAKEGWVAQMDELRKWSTSEDRAPQVFAARVAFALHFLEDSHAAGHLGVDRKTWYEQDYANAYHDDFNGSGRFLKRTTVAGEAKWYGYGDGHLVSYPTFYLVPNGLGDDKDRIRTAATDLLALLETGNTEPMAESNKTEIDELAAAFAIAMHAIANTPEKAPVEAVLSVPLSDGLFDTCFYSDNCEKFEAVVVSVAPANGCAQIKLSSSNFDLYKCDGETSGPVVQAATQTLVAAFAYWVGDDALAEKERGDAECFFPSDYRTLKANDKDGKRGGINKSAVAMEFDDWVAAKDVPTRRAASTEWGFSAASRFEAPEQIPRGELGWNIRLSDGLCGIRHVGAGDRPCGTGNLPDFIRYGKLGIVNRWSIVDSEGNFVDSLELAAYLDVMRPAWAQRVLGLSLKGTVGVDELWSGPDRRNVYGGGGVSIDVHLGKRVLYLDIDKQWHRNEHGDSTDSLRAMLGIRVMSIDLDRARHKP